MHPVLRRVYAQRGVRNPREVDHRLASLAPPDLLGGIDAACALLDDAIAYSAVLEAECAAHGLPFFDTSVDFTGALDRAAAYLSS